MKMNARFLIVLIALSAGGLVRAESQEDPLQHPCLQILQSCVHAGYVRGGFHEEKGLFRNCLGPILRGVTVAEVPVDATQIAACKEKIAERRRAAGGR